MGFIVGILVGIGLTILWRDVWPRLQFYCLLGIHANRQKQERKQAIKDLENYINEED